MHTKYGVSSFQQCHINHPENLNKEFLLENFLEEDNSGVRFLFDNFLEYFNISSSLGYKYLKDFDINIPNKSNKFKTQYAIGDFIRGLYKGTIIFNTKKIINPFELDILVEDLNLGIEYDGLLWHSEGSKDVYTDITKRCLERKIKSKTDLCRAKGIHLLTIWENEWLTKQDIWKSVIQTHLGLNKVIYARKCKVGLVPKDLSKKFQENCHLQGYCPSKVDIGLVYEGKLISIMTFGKARYDKECEWELLRFCSKKGYTVIGGASKLLHYFEENYHPSSLISYANKRWSNGNLYKILGFTYCYDSKPSYYYFKEHEVDRVYSRVNFQKHKLESKLENFDPALSERENMFNNGYRRIYDCGQMIFRKFYNGR